MSVEMMKTVISNLIDSKGFSLDEFPAYDSDYRYFAYRQLENGIIAVNFSREDRERPQVDSFDTFMRQRGVRVDLVNLVFSEPGYDSDRISRQDYHEGHIDSTGTVYRMDDEIRFLFEAPVQKAAPVQRRDTRSIVRRAPLTMVLILLNVIMFAITAYFSGGTEINIYVLIFFGAKVNELINVGEVWRIFTAAFLHGNFFHILLNMYALYNIGPVVEIKLGKLKYLLVYVFSALTSGTLSYFMTPNISVGASGAIFGVLGSLLIIALRSKEKVLNRAIMNIVFIIGLNLVIGVAARDVIDNYGHIGGLVGGLVSTLILYVPGMGRDRIQ